MLNKTGTISEETRQRVFDAAEKLNYRPNAFARHLKNRRSFTIGVFITRFGGAFYEEILDGIHEAVMKTDYELIVSPERQLERKILTQRQVDGAIVFDSKIKTETISKLAAKDYPIVVMDREIKSDYVLPLLVDNRTGVREVFHHFHNQGARRIGLMAGALDSLDNSERVNTFLEEASQFGLEIERYQGDFTIDSGHAAGHELLGRGDWPEAIFCANDQMAIGLIMAMNERGLKAPGDIAVAGFDDILIAQYMEPRLTTVGVSRLAWGSLAAEQLIDFLERGEPFRPQRIEAHLIVRESSILKVSQTAGTG